jgi:hypothetical protein
VWCEWGVPLNERGAAIQFYYEIEPEEITHQRGERGGQNPTEQFNFQIKLNKGSLCPDSTLPLSSTIYVRMNSQQCQTMLAALKSGCQNDAEFWAAVAELRQSGTGSGASSDAEGVAAAKKRGPKPLAERTPEQQAAHAAKKAAKAAAKASGASASSSDAEGAAPVAKPPKQQSDTQKAWIGLVSDTVKEMGAHGWSAWKDAKGVLWPASALNAEGQHVYSDGPHAGKTASHQRGGMARASFIKSQAVGLQGEWAEME